MKNPCPHQEEESVYLLNMRRVKMNAALLCFSLLGFSIIPEGTIRSCPSGEKQSRLKKDFSVSSWKRCTTLPCRSELSGTGNWALLTRLTNFLLLTLYTRHILWITKLLTLFFSLFNNVFFNSISYNINIRQRDLCIANVTVLS